MVHCFFLQTCKVSIFCKYSLLRGIRGEEVSISLVYALGLQTDQTLPIHTSKMKHLKTTWWNPENRILWKKLKKVGRDTPMETSKILTTSTGEM
jgi:hypothetical protein